MGSLGIVIPEKIKENLTKVFPQRYPRPLGHHITYHFGILKPEALPKIQDIEVLGMADDNNGIQALVLRVQENDTWKTSGPGGNPFHLTWSLNPAKIAPAEFDPHPKPEKRKPSAYAPAHANALVANVLAGNSPWSYTPLEMPIRLEGLTVEYRESWSAASPNNSNTQTCAIKSP